MTGKSMPNVKNLAVVKLYSGIQYIAGCRWLLKHGGAGYLWSTPFDPVQAKETQWWVMMYSNHSTFWFKDPQLATMFQLALPA